MNFSLPRDKIISLRVNSKLLHDVQQKINQYTEVNKYWSRTHYNYRDPVRHDRYDKFTIADLLEEKLKEYLEEMFAAEQTPSAKK